MTFDEYCDAHNIQPGEEPAAFGAYLNQLSGGTWDGAQHEVVSGGAESIPAEVCGQGGCCYLPHPVAQNHSWEYLS